MPVVTDFDWPDGQATIHHFTFTNKEKVPLPLTQQELQELRKQEGRLQGQEECKSLRIDSSSSPYAKLLLAPPAPFV